MRWLPVALLSAALALLLAACGGDTRPPNVTDGDRITVSIALRDDANRLAALFAIEQGIVTSDTIDVDVTYLTQSAIAEVALARQYDVIEVTPLAVPQAAATRDFDFAVLSGGLQNSDGTFLFAQAGSALEGPGDLRLKTIGVASLEDTSALETRYLLQQAYGLDVDAERGDITFVPVPAASLAEAVRGGAVDAAVIVNGGAFPLVEDKGVRVLSRVTDELRELLGAPVINSILVTYPDVAEEKAEALIELNRLLAESVAYFRANQESVIEAVAREEETADYLQWWWQRQELLFGDRSIEMQERLLTIWEVARTVGDLEEYPKLSDVFFNPEVGGSPP